MNPLLLFLLIVASSGAIAGARYRCKRLAFRGIRPDIADVLAGATSGAFFAGAFAVALIIATGAFFK